MPLDPPDMRELKAIVEWVNATADVRELSLKVGEVELFISRNRQAMAGPAVVGPPPAAPAVVLAPAAPVAGPTSSAEPAGSIPADDPAQAGSVELSAGEVAVTAPMVGIFYASPQPGAPAFVAVGDRVESDTVLCIVEVMKLMNTIEAGVSGTVARILVGNEQAVEYGQPLIVIRQDA